MMSPLRHDLSNIQKVIFIIGKERRKTNDGTDDEKRFKRVREIFHRYLEYSSRATILSAWNRSNIP